MSITVSSFVSNGVNYWREYNSVTGAKKEYIKRNGDVVSIDGDGNEYVESQIPQDLRPFCHVTIDQPHIKSDGKWFIDSSSCTFTLTIKDEDGNILTFLNGEFFATVRSSIGDVAYSQFINFTNGVATIGFTSSDLKGSAKIYISQDDYDLVQLAGKYEAYVDHNS